MLLIEVNWYKSTGKWYEIEKYTINDVHFIDSDGIITALEKQKGFIKNMSYTFEIVNSIHGNKRLVIKQ